MADQFLCTVLSTTSSRITTTLQQKKKKKKRKWYSNSITFVCVWNFVAPLQKNFVALDHSQRITDVVIIGHFRSVDFHVLGET